MTLRTALLSLSLATAAAGEAVRPNVLLIVVDDLADIVPALGNPQHPQARMPALDAFAATAVGFRRAYAPAAWCAPSRTALITGVHPQVAQVYGQAWFSAPALANNRTLIDQFRSAGYITLSTGKVAHDQGGPKLWDVFGETTNYGPSAFDGKMPVAHPSLPEAVRAIGWIDGGFSPLDQVPLVGKRRGWWDPASCNMLRYVSESDRDPLPDERSAAWAEQQIATLAARDTGAKPFLMAVGMVRPHTPMVAPREYFDRFPLDGLQTAAITDNDASDTHFATLSGENTKGLAYRRALRAGWPGEEGLRRYTQAYLACAAFADA